MILNQNFVANPKNLFQNFGQFNNQGKPNGRLPKNNFRRYSCDMNTKDSLHEKLCLVM